MMQHRKQYLLLPKTDTEKLLSANLGNQMHFEAYRTCVGGGKTEGYTKSTNYATKQNESVVVLFGN